METTTVDPDRLSVQEDTVQTVQPAVDTLETTEPNVQPEHDMPSNTEEAPANSPQPYSNGYSNGPSTHHPSVEYAQSAPALSSHEGDFPSRFSSPTMAYQQLQQVPQSSSRPGSGLSSGGDRYGYSQSHSEQTSRPQSGPPSKNSVVIKVGMVGDAQIGKTSLMVKYVEGSWDEDYIQTLGVNFMEKTISIRNTEITFSIWDLGGQREFVNMLPLVCNDAVAILFMFDLTRKSTLNSIKEWYRQGRGFNKTAIPLLVGTKYDHFVNFPREDQEEISIQAKRFAKAMRASLIFSSTSHSINVQKIFKIVLSKAFDLKCTIPEIENIGEPLLLYQNV
ncbi:septum-promoting GTP-binding protein 1 [Coccidioides immitis RS]|uniref:Septum-promoting GTP-binding protein 1 n=7 Tax=Coccidioides TaxID=5500 RepID=J3K288_COCIM|nr:septum-promoting GTP-binding protein 1 [Coccidioides immitis RS]XP_003067309.1 septum-promoting GTP-binding protein, putative [Coccidioides posadasii C735 delta SOWgp]EFW19563.1 septum-promoting GTP-binding protein 1 [Coccidioides posadasii str. Silveira]KMM72021.1 septum-promoting GTP-binding protein 1 [Coccidioides posadasii RMSCC 3488]KMP09016.1 septum-promoting GTP-binding protein 1 [Coccidioides immitis RMSCC 2394]KMU74172.1 septum-promoting GTP-binding protein 1 [Coccidioides immitis |eukprot:XP_003067309.1 septum-promoting GTP-binding protein, putative [Coccidioides posadasii C735 delta SOWgp]